MMWTTRTPWLLLCVIFLISCNSGNSTSDDELTHKSTAITFQLAFAETTGQTSPRMVTSAVADPDVCNDYHIGNIVVEVRRTLDNNEVASVGRNCGVHGLTVKDVPAEENLYVVCKGYVDQRLVWQGRVDDIIVAAGETKDIGSLKMIYRGEDQSSPQVISTFPSTNAIGVDLNTSIDVVFDKPLAPSTISDQAITVLALDTPVSGEIFYDTATHTIRFTPAGGTSFASETTYTAMLVPLNDDAGPITDITGREYDQQVTWQFTTRGPDDITGPQIIATSPQDNATDVTPQTTINAIFNEPMDPGSIDNSVITVSSDQETIAGQTTYDEQNRILEWTPDSPMTAATRYTATISTQALDLAQNPLPAPYSWQFTIEAPQYRLTVVKNGTGTGTVTSTPAGIDCGLMCEATFSGDTPVLLNTTAQADSGFTSWSGEHCDGSTEPCQLILDKDTTITANFTLRPSYTIVATAFDGGTISPANNVTVNQGDDQRFQIASNDGYYLSRLYVDGKLIPLVNTTTSYTFSNVSQNHSIQAYFKPVKYVTENGSGNGSTWANAFGSIQQAVDAAASGDDIWIKEGSYLLSAPIVVSKQVTLFGGFNGDELHLEQREPDLDTNASIIDGNTIVGCFRITEEAVLDGLIITNGNSNLGGGLQCMAQATLNNCRISNCTAYEGGGIYSTENLILENCEILNNQVSGGVGTGKGGGGICNVGDDSHPARLDVSYCRFAINEAEYDSDNSYGGAIKSENSAWFSISDTVFEDNVSQGGGAVYYISGSPTMIGTIERCRFIGNISEFTGGGAIVTDTSISILDSTFENNSVHLGTGGAILFSGDSSAESTIRACLFTNNSCETDGGAIYIYNTHAEINMSNSILYGNFADDIGGVYNNGTFRLTNCTVVSNRSMVETGGIQNDGTLRISNTILWGNTSSHPVWKQLGGNGSISASYSDIDQDGYEGSGGNIRQDPLLVNPAEGDFHLQSGSHCINAGNNDAWNMPIYDFEGDERIMDGTVDIGADEYMP